MHTPISKWQAFFSFIMEWCNDVYTTESESVYHWVVCLYYHFTYTCIYTYKYAYVYSYIYTHIYHINGICMRVCKFIRLIGLIFFSIFFSFFNAEWCPNSNRNLVIEIVYVSFPFRFSLFFSNVRRITTLYIKTKHYVFSCYFPQASFFF